MERSVLLIDLNNFARFPTLPVGLMVAALREARWEVEVLSPLAVGVPGIPRPTRAPLWGYWDERARWWSATTKSRTVRSLRRSLDALRPHRRDTTSDRLMAAVSASLERQPKVVLISAYLMYMDAVRRICAMCAKRGIPVLLGGPAFHDSATRTEWATIDGLTAIYAGESEVGLAVALRAILEGAPAPKGLTRPGHPDGGLAPPAQDLDAAPYPDYSDFPWDRYPNRIVSMLTGRGCGWGVCKFCSDVVTVAGRSFRSRSLPNVLSELQFHREVHRTSLFCFSDLKLNSNLEMWRGLHEGMQRAVPGAKWTCAVHVGPRSDEGLSRDDLVAARQAGLVRITAGFETASPRLLSAMRKGSQPDRMAEFLANAHGAGISTRITAFTGYPGEGPEDLNLTTQFLEEHGKYVERVHLSRLSIQAGTPLNEEMRSGQLEGLGFSLIDEQPTLASIGHMNSMTTSKGYKRSISKLLRAVHSINRRPIRSDALELEGAM
jgi:anaerobic magnesium-protoporphyrin IX monomethyl ester cyclase